MRSSGIQGNRNIKGTIVSKDDLALGLARRRAQQPVKRIALTPIAFKPRRMKKQ